MGTVVLMKKRNSVRSMAYVVDNANILRDFGMAFVEQPLSVHLLVVELHSSDELVEQIIMR